MMNLLRSNTNEFTRAGDGTPHRVSTQTVTDGPGDEVLQRIIDGLEEWCGEAAPFEEVEVVLNPMRDRLETPRKRCLLPACLDVDVPRPPQGQRLVAPGGIDSVWVVVEVLACLVAHVEELHRQFVLVDDPVGVLNQLQFAVSHFETKRVQDSCVESLLGVLVAGQALLHAAKYVREICLWGVVKQRVPLGLHVVALRFDLVADVYRVPRGAVEVLPLPRESADVPETVRDIFQFDLFGLGIKGPDRLPRVGIDLVVASALFGEDWAPEGAEERWDPDDDLWRAVVTGKTGQTNNVRWCYDDEEYAFTGLSHAVLREVADRDDPYIGDAFWYWTHPEFDYQNLSDLIDRQVTTPKRRQFRLSPDSLPLCTAKIKNSEPHPGPGLFYCEQT